VCSRIDESLRPPLLILVRPAAALCASSNPGERKDGSTPTNSKIRVSRLVPSVAQLVAVDDEDLLGWKALEVLLQLEPVAARGHEPFAEAAGGEGLCERGHVGPVDSAMRVVGHDPLDRVAHEIDDLRVGDRVGHPPRYTAVEREGAVPGRRLSSDRRGRVELRLVPREPFTQILLLDEEVGSFSRDIEISGCWSRYS